MTTNNIIETLRQRLPEHDVELMDVQKTNGIVKKGITIRRAGESIAPVIYLDGFDLDSDGIIEDIMQAYYSSTDINQDDITNLFTSFDAVKDDITFVLLNKELNQNLLDIIVYEDFLDLILVPVIKIDICNMEGIAKIPRKLADTWQVSYTDILDVAMENLKNVNYKITNVSELLRNMGYDIDCDVLYMYVITTYDARYGAALAVRDDVLEDIYHKLGGEYIMIPSSVHEWIVIKKEGAEELQGLAEMIRTVNSEHLEPSEILSDHAYMYSNGMRII